MGIEIRSLPIDVLQELFDGKTFYLKRYSCDPSPVEKLKRK
jgi:transposase